MDFRQRPATPIRPRGKKPAAVCPGGLAPAVAAIPATPGSCRPASPSPRAGGSLATVARGTGPPSAADARTPPSPPTASPPGSCSRNTYACHRSPAPRSANRDGDGPPPSSASSGRRRTGRAANPGFLPATSAHGTFGIVAVDGDLAVAFLAQGAGVLPGDAHGALALLGEARVIEDQDAVSLAGQSEHLLDTLAVELVLVPSRGGKQALELLFGGAGYARSDGIAVLVGQLGQQPSQVAIQGMSPFAAREMNMERLQERGQLGQWLGGSLRNTNGGLHTPLYTRTPKRQSSNKGLFQGLC